MTMERREPTGLSEYAKRVMEERGIPLREPTKLPGWTWPWQEEHWAESAGVPKWASTAGKIGGYAGLSAAALLALMSGNPAVATGTLRGAGLLSRLPGGARLTGGLLKAGAAAQRIPWWARAAPPVAGGIVTGGAMGGAGEMDLTAQQLPPTEPPPGAGPPPGGGEPPEGTTEEQITGYDSEGNPVRMWNESADAFAFRYMQHYREQPPKVFTDESGRQFYYDEIEGWQPLGTPGETHEQRTRREQSQIAARGREQMALQEQQQQWSIEQQQQAAEQAQQQMYQADPHKYWAQLGMGTPEVVAALSQGKLRPGEAPSEIDVAEGGIGYPSAQWWSNLLPTEQRQVLGGVNWMGVDPEDWYSMYRRMIPGVAQRQHVSWAR